MSTAHHPPVDSTRKQPPLFSVPGSDLPHQWFKRLDGVCLTVVPGGLVPGLKLDSAVVALLNTPGVGETVTHLTLRGVPVSDGVIGWIAACPNLVYLDLTDTAVTTRNIKDLFECKASLRRLEHSLVSSRLGFTWEAQIDRHCLTVEPRGVVVAGNDLDSAVIALLAIPRIRDGLTHLDLSGVPIQNVVLEWIAVCPKLIHLNLTDTAVTTHSLDQLFASTAPPIRRLEHSLVGSGLGCTWEAHIGRHCLTFEPRGALVAGDGTDTAVGALLAIPKIVNQLTHLNLYRVPVQDVVLEWVASCLNLVNLNIASTAISNSAITALLLVRQTPLRLLDLRNRDAKKVDGSMDDLLATWARRDPRGLSTLRHDGDYVNQCVYCSAHPGYYCHNHGLSQATPVPIPRKRPRASSPLASSAMTTSFRVVPLPKKQRKGDA